MIDAFKDHKLSEHPVPNFHEAMLRVRSSGESNHQAQDRGVHATKEILGKYAGENIVIGTHVNIMVLIMNYFYPTYDYSFWEQLEMPDIYQLTFYEQQLIQVKRVDKKSRTNNSGYTIFKRSEVQYHYQKVDFERKRMIGTISWLDKVILTIEVDLINDYIQVDGDTKQLAYIMSERNLDMDYIVNFKEMARIFVEK